jgi:hypothetical protein
LLIIQYYSLLIDDTTIRMMLDYAPTGQVATQAAVVSNSLVVVVDGTPAPAPGSVVTAVVTAPGPGAASVVAADNVHGLTEHLHVGSIGEKVT